MRMSVFILPVALALLLLSHISAIIEDEREQQMKKTYIIHMDKSNMPASSGGAGTNKYTRTLTNVGPPARYKVSVFIDPKLATSVKTLVELKPLCFSRAYEKKTYTVTFVTSAMPSGTDIFARLIMGDGSSSAES
ncbi:hypothetical protein C1H46_003650 [Malus baccata]|uniref:Subtilisin-like protease fibronectin type-III domain-containing protein n=1 Tax=Malus baccata TaxID=106549 RepID=A0A540NI76_MALBA|nr:hypothetical protein C1H46_003650 [Malus baccata]